MDLSDEDRKRLIEAIDKKNVDHWMRAILDSFQKFGDLEEDDFSFYSANLREALKVTDSPEIVEVRKDYVHVETVDMRIELINGELEVNAIN